MPSPYGLLGAKKDRLMKKLFILGLALISGPSQATTIREPAPEAKDFEGAWTVNLTTDPKKPYTQPMNLVLKADGTIEGDFYNSTIEAGRWKDDRGRICVSFRTSDGVGPYHSAACLVGKDVQGQTWAEHRNFLFNWNAVKSPKQTH
jgi:hypothetical protein